ncbi:MAG: hypothetical protein COA99_06900 [Moraxellaceae bacterium]|nr:MAG: hypothetical protein COA99_06900 [Moraxellaceae bacterium]
MLPMPPIEKRQVERLKSSRSLKIHETTRAIPVEQRPQETPEKRRDRRGRKWERRKANQDVAFNRRRDDRRMAFLRNSPQIREILANSGEENTTPASRQGVFVNEEV